MCWEHRVLISSKKVAGGSFEIAACFQQLAVTEMFVKPHHHCIHLCQHGERQAYNMYVCMTVCMCV